MSEADVDSRLLNYLAEMLGYFDRVCAARYRFGYCIMRRDEGSGCMVLTNIHLCGSGKLHASRASRKTCPNVCIAGS